MLKKTIAYTDYDGNDRSENFYFNLSKSEIMEMEFGESGGLAVILRKIIETNDMPRIISWFKRIVLASYGEKSVDGKRFIKSEEMREAFSQTEAYSNLFMELATNASEASKFINGILPRGLDVPTDQKPLPEN